MICEPLNAHTRLFNGVVLLEAFLTNIFEHLPKRDLRVKISYHFLFLALELTKQVAVDELHVLALVSHVLDHLLRRLRHLFSNSYF